MFHSSHKRKYLICLMDNFNNIFDELSNTLESECLLENTSLYFSSLKSDYERFKYCLTILENSKLLPSLHCTSKKNSVDSEKYRNDGNHSFVKRDDIKAIEFYSKSIALAPADSKEIALAYANRSAVSFALNHFKDSITDIDRALTGMYPHYLKYKLYERKGKCLLHTSKVESAEENFNNALNLINESNLSESKIKSFVETLMKELDGIKLKNSKTNIHKTKTEKCVSDDKSQHLTFINGHKIPKLSYPASKTIFGACDAIAIEYNKEMGRHIIASKNIQPGDVLVIERPFSSVLLPDSYNLYCFNCLKRCHTLLPCGNCTKVLFCSELCREKSLTTNHSIECRILDDLIRLGCSKLELLATRTLLVASKNNKLQLLKNCINEMEEKYFKDTIDNRLKGFDENNRYRSDNYAAVHWLATNTELRTNADLFRRACLACCIIHCIDQLSNYFLINMRQPVSGESAINSDNYKEYFENKCFAGSLLLKYMQIMPCNAHEVSEMCLIRKPKNVIGDPSEDESDNILVTYNSEEIGGALYPFLSLINHSCDPNVVRHSHEGDTVVLTAIQFIPEGDQILDNYGYHHAVHDCQIRQNYLLSQYHFTCKCHACCEDWPHYHMLPEENIVYKSPSLKDQVEESSKEFRNILKHALKGNYSYDNLNKLTRHLLLLQTAVERPWKEYSECQEAIKQTLSMFANHYAITNST